MGNCNSSKTRVRPFFRALLKRDPLGSTWLPTLLASAPRSTSFPYLELLAKPGNIRTIQPTLVNNKERALVPPKAFLRWLILHPESMTWPKDGHAVFGAHTQKWRERLVRRDMTGDVDERRSETREADRQHAISRALAELERLGAARSRGRWWAFEGFTSVDFYIETDHLRIYVEGKRTEALSPSTVWYPRRNQLLRNLESAQSDASGVPFACVIIAEESMPEMHSSTVEASLPHLEPAARQTLLRHHLGTLSWRQACALAEIDYAELPHTV